GAVALILPNEASRILHGFTSSARLHYLELTLCLFVGGAFAKNAPRMQFSFVFNGFGWVLIATTMYLLAMPWRWHSQFAKFTVPKATQYITVIGMCYLALGGLILLAAGIQIA
ncbi:MAG: hypothetical protein P8J27_08330, partial [Mariniblastus sp.]|nr:hypothetical protein [Mariniblastus sp.]